MENNWKQFEKYSNYDKDASYDTWIKLYLKVYPQVDIFNENFDFNEPEKVSSSNINRLVVKAKKGSKLEENFRNELKKAKIPQDIVDLIKEFQISGDTDFNIKELECHKLENYSLMPRTGNINNEKGKKGRINDNFLEFIKVLSSDLNDFIENPSAFNGRYRKELVPYREEIVKCARRAYFDLFDRDVEKYFLCVYFYGISEDDPQYKDAKEIFKIIHNENIAENEIAKQFWDLRRNILSDKFGIQLK